MRAVAFILVPKNSSLKKLLAQAMSLLKNSDSAKQIELRGEDIPFMVEEYSKKGRGVIGLTGEDLFREYCLSKELKSAALEVLKKIEWNDPAALFGKPVLCLLGPKGKTLEQLPKTLSVCISSKYRCTADKYLEKLEQQGFFLRKIYVTGCVETGYSEGIADIILDIVYSGSTMERNGLEVYEKIQGSDFVILRGKTETAGITPKKSILGVSEYFPPLEGRKGKLRLDFNENTIGCSPKVVEALKGITIEDISAYPGYESFISELAAYLKVEKGELLLTNGSDEAIKLVMDVFVEASNEVVIPDPTFKLFEVYAQMAGAKISKVMYNKDLSFPTKDVLESLKKNPRLLVLVNPNSPTGTEIPQQALEKILESAGDCIVLLDEAYWQFLGSTARQKVREYKNLIIMQTFSKAFGLAGLRLGFLIANAGTIQFLRKASSPYSVNSIAVKAAQAAIEDAAFVQDYVQEVNENRKFLSSELQALGIEVFPSQANFILARFGSRAKSVCEKLMARGILLRDMGGYQLLGGCLRITIGTMEQCELLLKEIKPLLRPQALLFDMDGVLVDVSGSYRLAIKKTAEFFARKEIESGEIQALEERGGYNNDWDLAEALLLEWKVTVPKDELISKFQEIYQKENLAANEKPLVEGKTLERLSKDFKLGIVTGRPREEAVSALEKFGIQKYFSSVVTADDVPRGKPDPCGIEMAMRTLGVESAYYFGDSVDDIQAAAAAKIIPIGVLAPSAGKSLENLMLTLGAARVEENIEKALEVFA